MDEENSELLGTVSMGQIRALNELLSESPNIDVNGKNVDGNFAAMIAAQHNDLPMLKLLVSHGARLDLKDGFGRTVMGWAKKHKNNEMVEFINNKLSESSTLSEGAQNPCCC